MKKVIIATAFVIATGFSLSAMAAENIGVVDMKQIFQSAPQVAKINDSLKTQFADRQAKLEKMSKDLQTDLQKLERNKAVMKPADVTTLKSKIAKEGDDFHNEQASYQQDLYDARQKAIADFMNDIKTAATSVAKDKSLTLILPEDSTLYSASDLDVTQPVLKELDKE